MKITSELSFNYQLSIIPNVLIKALLKLDNEILRNSTVKIHIFEFLFVKDEFFRGEDAQK